MEGDRECVSLNEGTRDPPLSCWINDSGVHQLSGTPHWMTKHLRIQRLMTKIQATAIQINLDDHDFVLENAQNQLPLYHVQTGFLLMIKALPRS